jgi:hypothetical protein
LEHNNYLGTAWAALGMTAYYLALVWINTLLGLFLTPLFLIPMTWLQDRILMSRRSRRPAQDAPAGRPQAQPGAQPAPAAR